MKIKATDSQCQQSPSPKLTCKNKHPTSGLVLKTWDIRELFTITPTLTFKPWDSKVPKEDPVNKEDQVLKSEVKTPPVPNEPMTWIAYMQDMKFKLLFMLTMIFLPLYEVMALKEEKDPGSHQHLKSYPGTTCEIQENYSIWVSYIQDMIFKFSLMTVMMSLFKIDFLEVEINQEPQHYSIPRLDHAYGYLFFFTTMLNNFRAWIAYIEDKMFIPLLVTTMFLLSSTQTKVPEQEIDPGPYQHSVLPGHTNKSLPKIIVHGALVIFQAWIAYIHKPLSSYLDQLNDGPQVLINCTPSIIPQYHS
jgi:hypothetical protein